MDHGSKTEPTISNQDELTIRDHGQQKATMIKLKSYHPIGIIDDKPQSTINNHVQPSRNGNLTEHRYTKHHHNNKLCVT